MAGASLAAELAPHASVLLAEGEATPGYHATGRSAAFWEECYGGPEVVPLTLASGRFAREQDEAEVDAFMARFADSGVHIERLVRSALAERVPGLRPEWTLAIAEPA